MTEKLRDPPGPDPRDESQAQRDDRNLAELLQELRISGLGVQVLFGFLLSLPFTARFAKLSHGQRELFQALFGIGLGTPITPLDLQVRREVHDMLVQILESNNSPLRGLHLWTISN